MPCNNGGCALFEGTLHRTAPEFKVVVEAGMTEKHHIRCIEANSNSRVESLQSHMGSVLKFERAYCKCTCSGSSAKSL